MRNASRHMLRTALTILGLAIAVMAFSVIRTAVDAWYAGAEASSPNRLVTINAISLTFNLPIAYREKMERVEGVQRTSLSQWFGGVYVDPKNFFAQFAVEPESYFELYPEFVVPEDQYDRFLRERNSVIVGRKLADRYGWNIGDPIRLTGTIYPGNWDFVVAGIYTGVDLTTDESQWFMHFEYIDERMRVEAPPRAGQVGSFLVRIDDPDRASEISQEIDALFKNSIAETLTQTEESFQLSFVSMASSIITGLKFISFLVIGIIMLVLANTMAMTARERVSEYSLMKTLGFGSGHIMGLIFGESVFIAFVGGLLGFGITFPVVNMMRPFLQWFPVFEVSTLTYSLAFISSIVVGFLAAIFPATKAIRTSIVDGLRIID
jgi:putative ABC transport system permease protein